jgi:hypothetical protein
MIVSRGYLRIVEWAASQREIFVTDEEAAKLKLTKKALAAAVKHLFNVRRTLIVSTSPTTPGAVAGYRYRTISLERTK